MSAHGILRVLRRPSDGGYNVEGYHGLSIRNSSGESIQTFDKLAKLSGGSVSVHVGMEVVGIFRVVRATKSTLELVKPELARQPRAKCRPSNQRLVKQAA